MLVELSGRSRKKAVEGETDLTLLELALKHNVDWGFFCSRGTCARCRCLIVKGAEYLSEPNEAELERLEKEEIEQGFRLGCQVRILKDGNIKAVHKPYF